MTPVNRMPATHHNYFYVLDNAPRPERRLLLRGGWKNEDALNEARAAVEQRFWRKWFGLEDC